jgi:hypothetical protein
VLWCLSVQAALARLVVLGCVAGFGMCVVVVAAGAAGACAVG